MHSLTRVRKYRSFSGLVFSVLTAMSLSSAALFVHAEETPARQAAPMPSLAPMLEQATPAVVNIVVEKSQRVPEAMRFFGGPGLTPGEPPVRRSRGAGSGVVVDAAEGYIITNHHVVFGADSISVGLQDGRFFDAELIGSDERTDIALLKVEADRLNAMEFADAAQLLVGDYVVAIGNPFGIGQTVTAGIISALGRAGINNENYEDFIQTDAAINVGNSGGALVDLQGRLVGINTAIISGSGSNAGVGFAVPADMVSVVMEHLLRDGEVRRGQLGVIIRDHTPLLEESLQLGAEQGALITQIAPGSAAAKAGLQVSDLVTAFEDKPVLGSRDLRNAVGLAGVGRQLSLTILRDGREMNILANIEGDSSETATAQSGDRAIERSPDDSRFFGAVLDDSEGVLRIDSIDQRSRAWAAGLRPGDVLTALNRQRINDLADLNRAINRQPRVMALTVEREGQALLLIMP